ncbi:MAG: FAD-dependent monooxygenase [Arthrobacter sp.]
MVGCEGGRSFTRQKLGIPFTGETRKQRGLVIDVANDPLGTPHAVFGGDPNRGYATLSLPHGIRRWEFMLLEGEDDALVESDEFLHKLLRDHVADPSKLDIIRRRVYEHHARIADRFCDGRVLLAGDAAHVMPVVAGQGWNSCIRDALNLGWKLTAVVRGLAGQELLDTYAEERRDHVKAMVDLSVGMAKVVTNRSKVTSAVRDTAAAVIDRLPKLKSYVSGQGFKPMPKYTRGVVLQSPWTVSKSVPVEEGAAPGAGTLFPQPRVAVPGAQNMLLDDAVRAGWRVLVWNNDPVHFLSEDTRSKLADLDASLIQLVPSAQLNWAAANASPGVSVIGDPAGELKSWFHARPVSAVVVRPDHVIAAECLAQDLERTLRTIFRKAHLRPARERAAATA